MTNDAGNVVSSSLAPMSPIYQVGSLPEKNHQQLLENIAFVPAGNSSDRPGPHGVHGRHERSRRTTANSTST